MGLIRLAAILVLTAECSIFSSPQNGHQVNKYKSSGKHFRIASPGLRKTAAGSSPKLDNETVSILLNVSCKEFNRKRTYSWPLCLYFPLIISFDGQIVLCLSLWPPTALCYMTSDVSFLFQDHGHNVRRREFDYTLVIITVTYILYYWEEIPEETLAS